MAFRVLVVGDIVGKPGRKAVFQHLLKLRNQYAVDFCVINAENAAGGKGITSEIAGQLFEHGADVLTLGNHVWDNKDIIPMLEDNRLLRPANYPSDEVPGHGMFRTRVGNGISVTVIHLLGRVFMSTLDCPFRKAVELLGAVENDNEVILLDFHAEATSEKKALAVYLDGRVSVVFGTHTHVQTADEQILPNGTAYITDVGMTGPHAGIIGMRTKEVQKRFLQQLPVKYQVATGETRLQAMLVDVEQTTGKAIAVERINLEIKK